MRGSTERGENTDIARLFERFQSGLLKYWEFEPEDAEAIADAEQVTAAAEKSLADRTVHVEHEQHVQSGSTETAKDGTIVTRQKKPAKKILAMVFDEAHKLP